MELLHLGYSLLVIVFIDLILSGDNAIVIGLACRNLPAEQQKKAVLWGTAGAIGMRVLATIFVLFLLEVPWLHLVGGLLLLWIASKLLVEEENHDDVKAGSNLWGAVRTIIVADAVMSLDNVLAVAGAAHGNIILVIAGLLISIPLLIKGSMLFIKLTNRFPWIVYIGAGVLAYTAAKMMIQEPAIDAFVPDDYREWLFIAAVILLTLAVGYMRNASKRRKAVSIKPAHK
ncbi:TerC family protein [Paenibacillus sp. GCM10027626]|uniref:TerC family protein n=1 Tax=Paenibacillus sp. GCM10027626 TaxID=3273411 RepID=UPI00362D7825